MHVCALVCVCDYHCTVTTYLCSTVPVACFENLFAGLLLNTIKESQIYDTFLQAGVCVRSENSWCIYTVLYSYIYMYIYVE